VTFCTWVDDVGGISAASRLMEKPQATVWAWYHLERFPRPKQLELINQVSGGQIDMDAYRREYLASKEQ